MRTPIPKRTFILCSSPNSRGIHTYALNTLDLFSNSFLCVPPGTKRFIWLLWEFFYPLYLLLVVRKSIIIFANTRINPLAFFIKTDNRLISILHDFMDTRLDPGHPISSSFLKRTLNSYLIEHSLHHADHVVTNSHITHYSLLTYLPECSESSSVLHPQLSFPTTAVDAACDHIHLPRSHDHLCSYDHRPIFFTVTGMTPNKSPDSYIDLVQSLSSSCSDEFIYYFVGLSPSSNIAQTLKSKFPHLTLKLLYRVSQSTLINLYLMSDAFISLSLQEGFGIPLNDALAFDIPSFVTSIPSFREISSLHHKPDITYFSPYSIIKELPLHLCSQPRCVDRTHRALIRNYRYNTHYGRYMRSLQTQVSNILSAT